MLKTLSVDYVSDLHLGFYLPYDKNLSFDKNDIRKLVETEIVTKKQGEILVIAGDICESIDCTHDFLTIVSEYYEKIFFVAGNHEYYLLESIYDKYNGNSINKIDELIERLKDNEKIVFLDRANSYNNQFKGTYSYKGFLLAGDTLWYTPIGFLGRDFYLNCSRDSSYIRIPPFSALEQIDRVHLDSIGWYDKLPILDLIVTHVPPVHNPESKYTEPNSCYMCNVGELKAPVWIYGHDHEIADFHKAGTRFLSNPWGYYSATLPIKNVIISKEVDTKEGP